VSVDAPSLAYSGLIKMHAAELHANDRFRRTGRISPRDVHAVARDLDQIGKPHPLDETIDLILARTDALELEREAASEAAR
jgi:hypothetical protein